MTCSSEEKGEQQKEQEVECTFNPIDGDLYELPRPEECVIYSTMYRMTALVEGDPATLGSALHAAEFRLVGEAQGDKCRDMFHRKCFATFEAAAAQLAAMQLLSEAACNAGVAEEVGESFEVAESAGSLKASEVHAPGDWRTAAYLLEVGVTRKRCANEIHYTGIRRKRGTGSDVRLPCAGE